MTLTEFITNKCEKIKPRRASELYRYHKEGIRVSGSSAAFSTYSRRCRAVFAEWNKDRIGTMFSEQEDLLGVVSRSEESDGQIESTLVTKEVIKNPEEMAKFCNINMEDYQKPKFITNRWGSSDNPLWQTKVTWIPKYTDKEIKPREAKEIFEKLISNIKPLKRKNIQTKEDGRYVEINIPDIHFGQLSWGDEIGDPKANYDISIAKNEFLKAIDYYANHYRNKDVKKFIFPLGSDLFNVNSEANTTLNGTLQDEDCRPKKTFMVVLESMLIALDMLSDIAPIDVIFIPGNHDSDRAFYLASALKMAYKNDPNINIDDSPQDRKYVKIGNTLLGLTHGKTKGKAISLENLPNIMADEAKELWGQCKYREMHIGHLHHKKTINQTLEDEFRGTIVRVLSSLAQIDYWHHSSGYRGTRQAEAFEYDEKKGMCSIIVYRPEE